MSKNNSFGDYVPNLFEVDGTPGDNQIPKWDTASKGAQWADDEVGSPGSGEANVQADWNVTDMNSDAFILNKPTIPALTEGDLINITTVGAANTIAVDRSAMVGLINSNVADWAEHGNTSLIPASKLTVFDWAKVGNTSLVPTNKLGSGTAGSTTFLRGDGTWAIPPAGMGGVSQVITRPEPATAADADFNSIYGGGAGATGQDYLSYKRIVANHTVRLSVHNLNEIGFTVEKRGWASEAGLLQGNIEGGSIRPSPDGIEGIIEYKGAVGGWRIWLITDGTEEWVDDTRSYDLKYVEVGAGGAVTTVGLGHDSVTDTGEWRSSDAEETSQPRFEIGKQYDIQIRRGGTSADLVLHAGNELARLADETELEATETQLLALIDDLRHQAGPFDWATEGNTDLIPESKTNIVFPDPTTGMLRDGTASDWDTTHDYSKVFGWTGSVFQRIQRSLSAAQGAWTDVPTGTTIPTLNVNFVWHGVFANDAAASPADTFDLYYSTDLNQLRWNQGGNNWGIAPSDAPGFDLLHEEADNQSVSIYADDATALAAASMNGNYAFIGSEDAPVLKTLSGYVAPIASYPWVNVATGGGGPGTDNYVDSVDLALSGQTLSLTLGRTGTLANLSDSVTLPAGGASTPPETLYSNLSGTALSRAQGAWSWANDLQLPLSRALATADDDKVMIMELTFTANSITRSVTWHLSPRQFRDLASNTTTTGSSLSGIEYIHELGVRARTTDPSIGTAARNSIFTRQRHTDGHDILRLIMATDGSTQQQAAFSDVRVRILLAPLAGGSGAGASTFLGLTDTPMAFGTSGQVAAVNAAGDGLEFVDAGGATANPLAFVGFDTFTYDTSTRELIVTVNQAGGGTDTTKEMLPEWIIIDRVSTWARNNDMSRIPRSKAPAGGIFSLHTFALEHQEFQVGELAVAMDGGNAGLGQTIQLSGDPLFELVPGAIMRIDDEEFEFTGYVGGNVRDIIGGRGRSGTTIAAHTVGTAVFAQDLNREFVQLSFTSNDQLTLNSIPLELPFVTKAGLTNTVANWALAGSTDNIPNTKFAGTPDGTKYLLDTGAWSALPASVTLATGDARYARLAVANTFTQQQTIDFDGMGLVIDARTYTGNDPAFDVILGASGDQKAFQFKKGDDSFAWTSWEYSIGGSGKPGFELGPGGSDARDVNLYREAANVLKTDDRLEAAQGFRATLPLGQSTALRARNTASSSNAADWFSLNTTAGGTNKPGLGFGNAGIGSEAAPDTILYRDAPNVWKTPDAMDLGSLRIAGTAMGASSGRWSASTLGTGTATNDNFLRGDQTWTRPTFEGLSDTPNGYGTAAQYIRVNSAADALEYADFPAILSEATVKGFIADWAESGNTSFIPTSKMGPGGGTGRVLTWGTTGANWLALPSGGTYPGDDHVKDLIGSGFFTFTASPKIALDYDTTARTLEISTSARNEAEVNTQIEARRDFEWCSATVTATSTAVSIALDGVGTGAAPTDRILAINYIAVFGAVRPDSLPVLMTYNGLNSGNVQLFGTDNNRRNMTLGDLRVYGHTNVVHMFRRRSGGWDWMGTSGAASVAQDLAALVFPWARTGNTDDVPTGKIPDLPASQITSGVFDVGRFATGGSDGQFLRRTSSGTEWATVTSGGGTDTNSFVTGGAFTLNGQELSLQLTGNTGFTTVDIPAITLPSGGGGTAMVETLYSNLSGTALSRAQGAWSWANDLQLPLSRALATADDDKVMVFELTFTANNVTRSFSLQISPRQFRDLASNALTTGTTITSSTEFIHAPGIRFRGGDPTFGTAARNSIITRQRHTDGHDVFRIILNTDNQSVAISNVFARVILLSGGAGTGTGATTFLGLTDTPSAFGTAGQHVVVNAAADGLEFVDAPSGGSGDDAFDWATVGNTDTIPDAKIPNLAASKITSGTFAAARLGTGTADGTKALYGDGTWGERPSTWAQHGNTDIIPAIKLGSGTADTSTYLRGDGSWQAVSSGGGVTDYDLLTDKPIINVTNVAAIPMPVAANVGNRYQTSDGHQYLIEDHTIGHVDRVVNFTAVSTVSRGTAGYRGAVYTLYDLPPASLEATNAYFMSQSNALNGGYAWYVRSMEGDWEPMHTYPGTGTFVGAYLDEARANPNVTAAGQVIAYGDGTAREIALYTVDSDFAAGTGGSTVYEVVPVDRDVGGISTFLDLSDTPSGYGNAGQYVKLNSSATALEFASVPIPRSGGPGTYRYFSSHDMEIAITGSGTYANREINLTQTGFIDTVNTVIAFHYFHADVTDTDDEVYIRVNGGNRVKVQHIESDQTFDLEARELVDESMYILVRRASSWLIIQRTKNSSWADWAGDVNTDLIPTDKLGSGTASSTTFLRGDGTWATPAGGSGTGDDAFDWATVGNTDTIPDAKIPNLAASKITSGTFAAARLGTGTADGTKALYGDGTWGERPSTWAQHGNTDIIPAIKLGSGTTSDSVFLRGDGAWHTPPGLTSVSSNNTLDGSGTSTDPLRVSIHDVTSALQERVRYYTDDALDFSGKGHTIGHVYNTGPYRTRIHRVIAYVDAPNSGGTYIGRIFRLQSNNIVAERIANSNTRSLSSRGNHYFDFDDGTTMPTGTRIFVGISRTDAENATMRVGSESSNSPFESYDDASADFARVGWAEYGQSYPAVGQDTESHDTTGSSDVYGNIDIQYSRIFDHGNFVGDGNVDADHIDSASATDGQVLTADGSGGAAWETPTSGGITQAQGDARYLQLTGGTMTGALTVEDDDVAIIARRTNSGTVFQVDGSSAGTSTLMQITTPTGGGKAFGSNRSGEGTDWIQFRYDAGGSGKPGFELGLGSSGRDIELYRDDANILRTPDTFHAAVYRVDSSGRDTTLANFGVEAFARSSSTTRVSVAKMPTTYINNDTGNSGNTIDNIWSGTQAEYDAIATKDDDTLYFVDT